MGKIRSWLAARSAKLQSLFPETNCGEVVKTRMTSHSQAQKQDNSIATVKAIVDIIDELCLSCKEKIKFELMSKGSSAGRRAIPSQHSATGPEPAANAHRNLTTTIHTDDNANNHTKTVYGAPPGPCT